MKLENLTNLLPKGLEENLQFRIDLHKWLATDEAAQKDFLQLCLLEPEVAYDGMFFTYDPRAEIGKRNRPFILRDKQRIALSKVKKCIEIGKDAVINKTREEGASELLIKYFTLYCMLVPDSAFLIGSRNQDLVDCTGDPTTLYSKIDYTINHLPDWLRKKLHIERSLLHFRILDTNSAIDGETTNENFGAGKRATALMLDEFGRVDPSLAKSIKDSVNDISRCIIYNSTHWYGAAHAFNEVLMRPDIERIDLLWYNNPEKNIGLYKSPKVGEIELVDKKYYFSNFPEIFGKLGYCFNIKDYETLKVDGCPNFKADGCEQIPGQLRSIYHDLQEKRRSYRDLCMNIWASPTGASNQYFDAVVNAHIRSEFVKHTTYEGEIEYILEPKNKFKLQLNKEEGLPTQFTPSRGKFKNSFKKRLYWWDELKLDKEELRPNQLHNYIIGCDIGFGTGASNSTAEIVDANTCELVGEYISNEHTPEEFADLVTALAKWVGGMSEVAYVIWERTGGHGINFGRRIIQNGLTLVYTKTTEQTKTRKRRQVYGWDNNATTKDDLLMGLKISLKEGLKTKPERKFIRIHSEDIVSELDSYSITDAGQIISEEELDEKSGARARHGDRVIGLGLAVLALQDQPKAIKAIDKRPPFNSFAWRSQQRRQIESEKKETWGEPKKFQKGKW